MRFAILATRFSRPGTKICSSLLFSTKTLIVLMIIYCLACQENLKKFSNYNKLYLSLVSVIFSRSVNFFHSG